MSLETCLDDRQMNHSKAQELERVAQALASAEIHSGFQSQLTRVLALTNGWDHGKGIAPQLEILAATVDFMVVLKTSHVEILEPHLSPTKNGYVLLEWTSESKSLIFEATEPGWYLVGVEIDSLGNRKYNDSECGPFDQSTMIHAYDWFIGAQEEWPLTRWISESAATSLNSSSGSSSWAR